jgi:hypothetical protein
MKIPMTAPNAINWTEVWAALVLLQQRFGLQSSYVDKLLPVICGWDSMTQSLQRRAVSDVFMYLSQSDQGSVLRSRIRELNMNTMLVGLGHVAMKLVGFKKLKEDEGGGAGTSVGGIGSSDNAIIGGGNSQPISRELGNDGKTSGPSNNLNKLLKQTSNELTRKGKRLFRGSKIVKKRTKKFKAIKFKAPDFMKVAQTEKRDEL